MFFTLNETDKRGRALVLACRVGNITLRCVLLYRSLVGKSHPLYPPVSRRRLASQCRPPSTITRERKYSGYQMSGLEPDGLPLRHAPPACPGSGMVSRRCRTACASVEAFDPYSRAKLPLVRHYVCTGVSGVRPNHGAVQEMPISSERAKNFQPARAKNLPYKTKVLDLQFRTEARLPPHLAAIAWGPDHGSHTHRSHKCPYEILMLALAALALSHAPPHARPHPPVPPAPGNLAARSTTRQPEHLPRHLHHSPVCQAYR